MKKKVKLIILSLCSITFLIVWFIPFTNADYNKKGEYRYCRYRMAVYEFCYIEAEGEGYGESDTYIGNIDLTKKIGGPLEYFGFKRIEKPTIRK